VVEAHSPVPTLAPVVVVQPAKPVEVLKDKECDYEYTLEEPLMQNHGINQSVSWDNLNMSSVGSVSTSNSMA